MFKEAGEGGRWAIGLEALNGFVGFEGNQLATHDFLECQWVAWSIVARRAPNDEVAIVVEFATGGFKHARNIGVVLHRVFFECQ